MKCLYTLISVFLLSYYVSAKSLPVHVGKGVPVVDMNKPCSDESLSMLRYYLPYPTDETKYIECNPWGFYTIEQCESGFKWNSWLMACVPIEVRAPVQETLGLEKEMNETLSNRTVCNYIGENKCLNGGICNVYLDGVSTCLCLSNWTGVYCETPLVDSKGVFGVVINESFSLDLYKDQRPLVNTSLEFNITDPELVKDPETKTKIQKYMSLYPNGVIPYHEMVNYLVDDFLSLLYPTSFYLQEFNFPAELETGLSGAIPNLLMSARYSFKNFDSFMRIYEDILDHLVGYLVTRDPTIQNQATLFYDVYVQIIKMMEKPEGKNIKMETEEDLTREETIERIHKTFNMTLEKAYELFKVANVFDDDLATKGENFTTEQIVYEIGNFSISPPVVQLVSEIQEINSELWDSLSFYGFWYILSSYVTPLDTVTTVVPPVTKLTVRSADDFDFSDETDIEERSDEYYTDEDIKRELLLETTRVPKSLLEETTRIVKNINYVTPLNKRMMEETTHASKKSVDVVTPIPKCLDEVESTTKSMDEAITSTVDRIQEQLNQLVKEQTMVKSF